MAFSDTLAQLRKESGYSQVQVLDYLKRNGYELSQGAISKWEHGLTTPNAEQFILLCRLYKVRDVLAAFLGMEQTDSLNALGKKRVAEYIQLLEQDERFSAMPIERPSRLLRTIPLYELPVSAGTGQFLDQSDYELIEVDETVPLSATFAVRISGDSMLPRFVNQQVIYVKQQQTLEYGEIGVFIVNGNAYCKQLGGKDGSVALISLNKKYDPIEIMASDEMRVLGKVVA
ncbi:MAG: S24 family peptidase [Faecousia sp.]